VGETHLQAPSIDWQVSYCHATNWTVTGVRG